MLLAIFCSRTVLPVRGGATIRPRWPLPIGVTRSMTRMLISVGVGLQHEPLVGVQRRQVVEDDLLRQHVGVLVVDRLDAQQGEVALVLLGRADLAGDDGAGAQAEAADLAGRDVDVVRAGQVVVVGAAQEAEAVGQDFERALAEHQAVLLDALLEDLEDQVLLLQPGVVGEPLVLGDLEELRHGHLLQLGDVRAAALDLLVAVVGLGVEADMFLVVEAGIASGGLRAGFRRRECLGQTWPAPSDLAGRGRGADRVAVFSASAVRHDESSNELARDWRGLFHSREETRHVECCFANTPAAGNGMILRF